MNVIIIENLFSVATMNKNAGMYVYGNDSNVFLVNIDTIIVQIQGPLWRQMCHY